MSALTNKVLQEDNLLDIYKIFDIGDKIMVYQDNLAKISLLYKQ